MFSPAFDAIVDSHSGLSRSMTVHLHRIWCSPRVCIPWFGESVESPEYVGHTVPTIVGCTAGGCDAEAGCNLAPKALPIEKHVTDKPIIFGHAAVRLSPSEIAQICSLAVFGSQMTISLSLGFVGFAPGYLWNDVRSDRDLTHQVPTFRQSARTFDQPPGHSFSVRFDEAA